MSRQAIWAIGLLLGAAVIAAAMIILRPEPEDQELPQSIGLVETVQYSVTSGPLEIAATGTVLPREEVSIGAEISGRLVYVHPDFREGGSLSQGELLFRIDGSDFRNRVRSAQADVAAQEVAVMQAQEEMAIAAAELQRFAQREAAGSGGQSARILPPEGLQAVQPSPASEASAASGAPNILATREPQLRSAEAARDRAAAQLADARLALSRTEVRAPFSGLVRSESISVGSLVQPGQALGSIVALDAFEVRVSLTENEAGLIPSLFAAGQSRIPAQVMLDYGGEVWRWNAFVDRADAILDPETRTIDVFLRVPNPIRGGMPMADGATGSAPPLLLGSFVRAAIAGAAGQPFARIPLEALREGNQVWLLSSGKLRIVSVDVIQRSDDFVHVASPDLGEGGHVITSSLRTPVEGMSLRNAALEGAAGEGDASGG